MTKAANPPWKPQPPVLPDLTCPHCETAKDVVVQADPALDATVMHLWCARCGYESTIAKPPRWRRAVDETSSPDQ